MKGPGKYDKEAQELLERLKAKGLVLLVFDGDRGYGMAVKAQPHIMAVLPEILRKIADGVEAEIDRDLKESLDETINEMITQRLREQAHRN